MKHIWSCGKKIGVRPVHALIALASLAASMLMGNAADAQLPPHKFTIDTNNPPPVLPQIPFGSAPVGKVLLTNSSKVPPQVTTAVQQSVVPMPTFSNPSTTSGISVGIPNGSMVVVAQAVTPDGMTVNYALTAGHVIWPNNKLDRNAQENFVMPIKSDFRAGECFTDFALVAFISDENDYKPIPMMPADSINSSVIFTAGYPANMVRYMQLYDLSAQTHLVRTGSQRAPVGFDENGETVFSVANQFISVGTEDTLAQHMKSNSEVFKDNDFRHVAKDLSTTTGVIGGYSGGARIKLDAGGNPVLVSVTHTTRLKKNGNPAVGSKETYGTPLTLELIGDVKQAIHKHAQKLNLTSISIPEANYKPNTNDPKDPRQYCPLIP